MTKPLVQTIEDGFKAVNDKNEEQDTTFSALIAEVEYLSCLMELQNNLIS